MISRRNNISGLFALLTILTVATTLVAQSPSERPGRERPGRERPGREHRAKADVKYVSQAALGKGVTQAQLSSGLTVLIQENHAAPVATVRCFVRNTGSAFEGRYLGTGISHMLEHLVALGSTTKRPEPEIQKLLDSMGGQTNAFTSTDMTAYFVDCPSSQADLAIELIADSMQYSLIPENEYVREMEVVQRELEMGEASRGRMQHQAMKSLIYTEHPIRHPTIGYLPVVQSVDRSDVIAFYKNRYVPQNMIFLVVGDVDTAHVLDQVLEHFKTFQRTTERGAVLPVEPDQASARSNRLEMAGETTNYSVGWPTVMLQHPDLYPLDVASYLLAHGDSSRLGYRLKIEQPLALSVSSSSYTPGIVKGWFDVSVQCQPANTEACRKAIYEEIERLKTELVSEKELSKVKRQKAAEHVFQQQTVQEQCNSLAYSFISTGDPLFDEQYVTGIQGVTPEQIQAVARKYFLSERTNTVVIHPIGRKQEVEEHAEAVTESPVVRKKLANGLTVLLKRHSVTPTVSIQAFVNGGALADTSATSGLAALTTAVMERGTEKYTGREIAEHFDSIGGSFGTSSQRNTSFLRCSVLSDDFEEALDYAHQVLFRPTFPAEEFAKVKQQQLAGIAARKANPQTEILDFWSTMIPQSSPYGRTISGTNESVTSLTVQQCNQFHKKHFAPDNMVLAIFGDINVDETLSRIEASFGKESKSRGLELPTFPRRSAATEAKREQVTTAQPGTAMVLLGYPTVNALDLETRATLDVFNSILTGGAGAGGRLFNELRGEGLVYYVFGIELSGQAPGYFLFMAQTRPETADEVVNRIQANVQRLADEGIAEEDFELAKQKLIAAHAQRNVTPATQAFKAAVDELYGLGYDNDKTYEARINKVTVADLQALVAEYFQNAIIATSAPATE
ncbi:MAG: insulinase family protein [Planctomycetes bacterium]|nr:insulinase family protein [Planctomycetota bacterium]